MDAGFTSLIEQEMTPSDCHFFISKARHNLETARLIWKISDDLSTKEKLAIRHDYEAYDWVISTGYYAIYPWWLMTASVTPLRQT